MIGTENTPQLRKKLARIVALTWVDPEYRARLLSAPRDVFAEEGIELPEGVRLTVLEDTPTHRNLVLADKPLPPQSRVAALPAAPGLDSVHAHVYERARQDPEFKRRLLASPGDVVRILGARLAPHVTCAVHEETPTDRYFVLPPAPRARVTTEPSPPGVVVLDASMTNVTTNLQSLTLCEVATSMDCSGMVVATSATVVSVAVLI